MKDKDREEQSNSEKPIRARLRRLHVSGATYFVTVVTKDRQKFFSNERDFASLRDVLHAVKDIHPFVMRGFVFLPEHFHLLLHIPEDGDLSRTIQSIKWNYTLTYKKRYQIEMSFSIWQKRFWDHLIRDEIDFRRHLDYIHYNPVKHGLVKHPEDYPHSSYLAYIERGWYDIGWGYWEPQDIGVMNLD